MKLIISAFALAVLSTFSAFAHEHSGDHAPYDVKKGVERIQYEWTRLNDKDRELLKESSQLEKASDAKIKEELEVYKAKTDELYNGLSHQSKKFLSEKSKLYKKLSNKAKKFVDELYFLTKKGVKTFEIPGIDDLMPLSGIKSDAKTHSTPVVNGKSLEQKK